jgi:hypothetical protein
MRDGEESVEISHAEEKNRVEGRSAQAPEIPADKERPPSITQLLNTFLARSKMISDNLLSLREVA